MALSAGTRLGPYEILAPLGAGGMGEVYRARDQRLRRDVALKVLPPELASEPERLERFEREAQTLAALNHPHIVTIFSVEQADDLHFLTMELVGGQTLTRVIPRGGLPLSRFFQLAVPLVEAVSAAHEKGIIHRDLKPGNVMVTEEDRVKVLDFGLAKLWEGGEGRVDSQGPTEPATGPGHVLGTAPYMSPEQVQARTLDHRSDVFSLGIIFYEMAAGQRPFTGESFADVASSILRDSPRPLTERRGDLPRDLWRVVKRCLEKEPQRRIQSVLDLRNELAELKQESDSGVLLSAEQVRRARAPKKKARWLWEAAALVAVGVAVGGGLYLYRPEPERPPARTVPFTSDPGYEYDPALSPDGKQVAFIASEEQGRASHLYVRLVDGGDPLALTSGDVRDSNPAWSPDGTRIAFLRAREEGGYDVLEIPALGGATRQLATAAGLGLFWSPEGGSLAIVDTHSPDEPWGIFLLSTHTGEKRRATSPTKDGQRARDLYPAFSPDGRALAFVRAGEFEGSEIRVLSLGAEETIRVTRASYFVYDVGWAAGGDSLVFSAGATLASSRLMRVPVAGGSPEPLSIGERARSFSVVGERLVYAGWLDDRNIWRVSGPASEEKSPPAPLIASTRDDMMPAYSPDGTKIAFVSDRAGTMEIWTSDADGTNSRQLTDLGHAIWPRWSPSGGRIAFNSMPGPRSDVYVLDAAGGFPEALIDGGTPDWSADARWLYYMSPEGPITRIPAQGGPPKQLTENRGLLPHRAPGGQVFYSRDFSPENRVLSVSTQGGESGVVLDTPVNWAQWCVWQGNLVFIRRGAEKGPSIEMFDLTTRQTTELVSLAPETIPHMGLAVSPDGRWILYTRQDSSGADLMLVEDFR